MSYLEYNVKTVPTGARKILYLNWPLVLLLTAVASVGFIMLYSVAGGEVGRWAEPQMQRYGMGLFAMFVVAMVPIWFWRNIAPLAYVFSLVLLLAVELFGTEAKGAQRWIDLGFMRLQPSESPRSPSSWCWPPITTGSTRNGCPTPSGSLDPRGADPDPHGPRHHPARPRHLDPPRCGRRDRDVHRGGQLVVLSGTVIGGGVALVSAVFTSRGTEWQLLKDYQYRRIDTFLDPSKDPLGSGYHITQSKIALGSGGFSGRGFMQGTQTRLEFLPEKHTDFIFTTLAEEFGFVGALSLLVLYALVILFCVLSAMSNKDRFSSLLIYGIAATFFLYFAVNMSMVMGLAPVVGVPLPLVSYGGSVMLVLMAAFGLVQSAHVHRPRGR